jgi:adenylosuccinate lyase
VLERVLVEAVKHGADRQTAHESLRIISMKAWEAIKRGEPNPLAELLIKDQEIAAWIPEGIPVDHLNSESFVGNAATCALALADLIRLRFNS